MPVTITVVGEHADQAAAEFRHFAMHLGMPGVYSKGHTPPETNSKPAGSEPAAAAEGKASPVTAAAAEPEKRTRGKKAPAADAVIDQKPANDEGAPMLTIDDARERLRSFNAAGHMDQGLEALASFGAKKLSEVDPEAGGNPSLKYAALIAKVEELVAAKG